MRITYPYFVVKAVASADEHLLAEIRHLADAIALVAKLYGGAQKKHIRIEWGGTIIWDSVADGAMPRGSDGNVSVKGIIKAERIAMRNLDMMTPGELEVAMGIIERADVPGMPIGERSAR